MNILVVDDQKSVLEGLKENINFKELGFETVFFVSGAQMARKLVAEKSIQIILCDIEMPGEDGLSLNEWVRDTKPEIIRILLTSHAEFSYAQKSLKLGCFDYIVQPAPYDEIRSCLSKAAEKYIADEYERNLCRQGQIYDQNKQEMLEKIVYKLFSQNEEDIKQSLHLLNEMNYVIREDSVIRLFMFNPFDYVKRGDSNYSDFRIRQVIAKSLAECGIVPPTYQFTCVNRYYQYVVLLVSSGDYLLNLAESFYTNLYEKITDELQLKMGMYISGFSNLKLVRKEVKDIKDIYMNNTCHKPGIYYTSQKVYSEKKFDFMESMHRWKIMLTADRLSNLKDNILSYIDFLTGINKLNYVDLCNLHQQLTQLFFNYAYENKIDIMELFDEQYSYNDYMDAFSDSNALKNAVEYIIDKLECISSNETTDIDRAKRYILDNLSKNLTVKDVADYIHRSPEHFTKVFKAATGVNIKNYILQLKLDVAKDLLATPNVPVSMIASEVGYDNFSHFTQIFKKYEDITPSEYRKKVLGEK